MTPQRVIRWSTAALEQEEHCRGPGVQGPFEDRLIPRQQGRSLLSEQVATSVPSGLDVKGFDDEDLHQTVKVGGGFQHRVGGGAGVAQLDLFHRADREVRRDNTRPGRR